MIIQVKYSLFANGMEASRLTPRQLVQVNQILKKVAAAYEDDPGVSDLDDEQSVYPVKGLNLGDVRLARLLTR